MSSYAMGSMDSSDVAWKMLLGTALSSTFGVRWNEWHLMLSNARAVIRGRFGKPMRFDKGKFGASMVIYALCCITKPIAVMKSICHFTLSVVALKDITCHVTLSVVA